MLDSTSNKTVKIFYEITKIMKFIMIERHLKPTKITSDGR